MKDRQQIRFNESQKKQLEMFMFKTKVNNISQAVHLAIQYGLKYFNIVTRALETDEFVIGLMRKTNYYEKKDKEILKIFKQKP